MASEQGTGTALKRRGILAAAGAVVAGIVAKQAAQPVRATPGGGDQGFLALGSNPWYIAPVGANTPAISSAPTVIQASANFGNFLGTNGARPTVLDVDATPAIGKINAIEAYGQGGGIGVFGRSTTGQGLWGDTQSGYGVLGQALGGTGMYGNATSGTGVSGGSTSGTGVIGGSTGGTGVSGSSGSGDGVRGFSNSGFGVFGYASTAGTTSINAGVYGFSFNTYGVIGSTTAPGYSGLTAITTTAGVAALAATSTNASAYAAYFSGATVVQGDFVAFGGSKSAAVPDATGQHRLVYCVESPEAWFEDFGTGHLVNGKADVALDKTFAEIVHTNDYHVFLTPDDDCKGFFVTAKRATGFTVRERQGGTSSIGFSWRVVARRKDIVGERLAKFAPPRINHPDPDKLPKPEPPPRKP